MIFGHDVLLGTSCCCKQAVGNEAERCGAGPPSEPVFPEHELYKCFSVCFFFPLRLDRSWVCPLLKVTLALTKPRPFRFRLAGFSGGQAKLRREECSGTFRKFIFPSRSQKREGFFSDISCEQQVAFPEVKLMTTWILLEVLALGLVLTESLAIRQLQFRVSCHGTGSHGGL